MFLLSTLIYLSNGTNRTKFKKKLTKINAPELFIIIRCLQICPTTEYRPPLFRAFMRCLIQVFLTKMGMSSALLPIRLKSWRWTALSVLNHHFVNILNLLSSQCLAIHPAQIHIYLNLVLDFQFKLIYITVINLKIKPRISPMFMQSSLLSKRQSWHMTTYVIMSLPETYALGPKDEGHNQQLFTWHCSRSNKAGSGTCDSVRSKTSRKRTLYHQQLPTTAPSYY